jgi:zinc transport system substrate-binding protein
MRLAMAVLAALVPVVLASSGCGTRSERPPVAEGEQSAAGAEQPLIVTNLYPVQWLAQELVGDQASVISLTPEGTEPHDLALDAKDRKEIDKADVVLYLGADFQPDVQRAVDQLGADAVAEDLLTAPGVELLTAGDIGKETLAGGKDPHVWLSPVEMIAMADAAAGTIETALPQLAPTVETNLAQLRTSLEGLDARYRTELTNCDTRVLVTSHAAFGYLADAYGLQQVPIAGVTPEDEPDPKTLQSIAEIARQDNVKTVFFEDALPSDLSQTVADEIGAQISLLSALEFDPRGSIGPDENYLSVMDGNLDRIAKGLGCRAS